jgi:hypothetical protein
MKSVARGEAVPIQWIGAGSDYTVGYEWSFANKSVLHFFVKGNPSCPNKKHVQCSL